MVKKALVLNLLVVKKVLAWCSHFFGKIYVGGIAIFYFNGIMLYILVLMLLLVYFL